MTRTVLLNCPIKAEIRAFENFVIVMIKAVICAKALSGDSCYWRSRKSDRPQLNSSDVTAATSQRLKVGNYAAKPLPRASKNLQRLHSAFVARCNLNEAAVWLLKGC